MSDHSDIWKYAPSIPLAVIAAAVFIALTGIHGYQLFRTKTWYFIAFWIGGVCECVGYLTVSASDIEIVRAHADHDD